MHRVEPRTTRRTVIKAGAGLVTVGGVLGGLHLSTQPTLAAASDDDAMSASDTTLNNSEQKVSDVTLTPSFDLAYANFGGGIDEIDLTVRVMEIVANVSSGFSHDASTLVDDWWVNSNDPDVVAFDQANNDGGYYIQDETFPVGSETSIGGTSDFSASTTLDATNVTADAENGTGETAAVTSAFSLFANNSNVIAEQFPGGGDSTEIMDDEAAASKVTLEYTVALRDTDNSVVASDTESPTFHVIIDNPSSDADVSGSSGTGSS